jgi:hypothetical protein
MHCSIDIYSFSVILWELATGRVLEYNLGVPGPPYDRDDVNARVRDGTRPLMYDAADVCGEEVVQLIKKCWDVDRQTRPSSSEIKVRDPLSFFQCVPLLKTRQGDVSA